MTSRYQQFRNARRLSAIPGTCPRTKQPRLAAAPPHTPRGARRRCAARAATLSLLVGAIVSPARAVTYYATYRLAGGTATEFGQAFSASATDTSAVWVSDSGILTLNDCTVVTTGDTSSEDSSSFYGLNAGVLAATGKIYMTGGSVTTSGTGANGVFATGSGSSVTLSDVKISATADGGHAVMATQGGSLVCTNVDMTTAAAHAGAIATDRGGGTILVSGGTVTTSGQDSPGIYSTGDITVSGATIAATGAEAAVIEGANSITLTNTALSSSFADKWGAMIYQSMSGDAEGTRGVFTMSGGSLAYTAADGPLFFVTNTTGVITLTNVAVVAASGTLVSAAGTTRWGTSGSNGGTVIFTADGETLTGDLITDDISSITATLKNGTKLTGAINSAALSLDATSTWTVTDTSYLTAFADPNGISGTSVTNIVGNGHDVYYDSSLAANNALGGRTYSLVNGGQLLPGTAPGSSTADLTDVAESAELCGTGACGAGIVGYVPLSILGLCGLKLGHRRRHRQR